MLLAGLFKDDEVDPRLCHHLASILEEFTEKKILAQIASDHVKKAIKRIDDLNDTVKVNLTVGAIWPPL